MALSNEQLQRIAQKSAAFTRQALDGGVVHRDATGKSFPLGRGREIHPPGFKEGHAPAFNRSPLGEDGYSLRRVVQALATGDPSEASFEVSLSQKLQGAGFPCGPKSLLIPIPGCLWYPAGHEALVKSVETEFSESFPSS